MNWLMDWLPLGTLGTGTICMACGGTLILVLFAVVWYYTGKSHRVGKRGVRWDDPTETFAKFVGRNPDTFYPTNEQE